MFWRGSPQSGLGHVGFHVDSNETDILVLGGNQSDRVCEKWYPRGRLLGYRWPNEP